MTRAEIVAVLALAGPEAERLLPFAKHRTRRGVAIHEAGHCIAVLSFGVPVVRVMVEDDQGVTKYVENAGSGRPLEFSARARSVAMLALPECRNRQSGECPYLFEGARTAGATRRA